MDAYIFLAIAVPIISLAIIAGSIKFSHNKRSQRNNSHMIDYTPLTTAHYFDTPGAKERKINKTPNKKTIRKDIKVFNNVFKSIWNLLRLISEFNKNQELVIKKQCGHLEKYLFIKELKQMDVSLININGARINTSIFKHYCINTIYDLSVFRGQNFESLNGIGPKSANRIRVNLIRIKDSVLSNIRIRLSSDDKNEWSNELVKSIAIYLDVQPYIEKAEELASLKPEVDSLIKQIKRLIYSLNFLFNPQGTISKIESLYEKLFLIYDEKFANINSELVDPFNKEKKKTYTEAWNEFSNNPIAFNKVIEKFAPHKAGYSTDEYGLDAAIAKKVKETPLNLEGFKLGLRTYQEWGTKYILCQKKTILGDEMGLGKTVQAIAAMVDLSNKGAAHFMVICPLSVLTNWCREIFKFSSLRYFRIHGQYKNRYYRSWIKYGGVAVTTYETLSSLNMSDDLKINLLVVDEAHYVKNENTVRAKNTVKFIKKSDNVTFLTGTVLENNVNEMITLIGYLKHDVALSASNYVSNNNEFKRTVSQVYFRRKREDVLSELPEKTEIEDWCDLNDEELKTYKSSIISHSFNDARCVSWNVDSEVSTKMHRLKEIVEMAKDDGRKVLVFSFFLNTVDKIYKEFSPNAYGPINGSVPSSDRQAIIDKFNNAPAGSVLVSQINSGGVGLNIQSASVVVICEPQNKPSTENQAISRSYRMGQSRKVLIYRLLAADTVDERMNEILYRKQKEFDNYADDSLVAEYSYQIDTNIIKNIMEQEYQKITNSKDSAPITEHIEPIEALKPSNDVRKQDSGKSTAIPILRRGVSVTRRIDEIKQPRGGYLPVDQFRKTMLGGQAYADEDVNPSLVGTAVDYLTRFMNGASAEDAFRISLLGAKYVNDTSTALSYLKKLNRNLDDQTIINAIKLVSYDVAFRAGPIHYKPMNDVNPSTKTISNIRGMVNRSIDFFEEYGPITKDGFDLQGAYTDIISTGDGDYLTLDTLWDFKVSKKEINSKHTLQVLIYYLMGIRSKYPEFKTIKYLGIYNPRLNYVYRYQLENLSKELKKEIEETVIGYK